MGKRSVFVLGSVNSVLESYVYPCCRSANCYRRVRALDDEQSMFICNRCFQEYKREDIAYRYRVTLVTSDATQTAEVTLFGSCLDHFFGCNATEFNSMVCCIESECNSYGIPVSELVHQAMEQCFIGSLLNFGFKVEQPFRKTSHLESSSPVKLADIATRGCRSHTNPNALPRLTACQILKAIPKEPLVTVLDILTETVRQIWGESPNGNPSIFENSQKECKTNSQVNAVLSNSHGSLFESQPTRRGRPLGTTPMLSQYCTPRSLSEFVSPMVLTCDSNSSAEEIKSQLFTSKNIDGFPASSEKKKSTSLNAVVNELQGGAESTNLLTSFNNGENKNSSSPDPPVDVFKSSWADPDGEQVCEFPSSMDLSAFLTDLVLDEAGQSLNEKEQNTNENTSVHEEENKRSSSKNGVRVRLGKHQLKLEDNIGKNSWMSCLSSSWQYKANSTEDITNALELPRCASTSVNETGQSVFLENSPLSLSNFHDAEKSPLNQPSSTSNLDWNEVSDFPSSEDLEAFLANIESSYFGNGVSRSSFSNTSIQFTKSIDPRRKHSIVNKKLILDPSQEQYLGAATGINTDGHQTDLDDCVPFRQFSGQQISVSFGSKASRNSNNQERPFENNETFVLNDSHSVGNEEMHLRCGEDTACCLGEEKMNDEQCFIRESFEATSEDLCECSKDKYEWKSEDVYSSESKHDKMRNCFQTQSGTQDVFSALIKQTNGNPWNEGSQPYLTYTDTPELFSQSFSPSCCECSPLLFSHNSPEKVSSFSFVEDIEHEASRPIFPRSQFLNEPCSPLHAKFLQTRSSEEMLLYVRNHSTPLYTNCPKFGSTRVNRVLFSSVVKGNTCLGTPITCRSGYCSDGKLSCPMSFTSSFDSDELRYSKTPLLFSQSSSNVTGTALCL